MYCSIEYLPGSIGPGEINVRVSGSKLRARDSVNELKNRWKTAKKKKKKRKPVIATDLYVLLYYS